LLEDSNVLRVNYFKKEKGGEIYSWFQFSPYQGRENY